MYVLLDVFIPFSLIHLKTLIGDTALYITLYYSKAPHLLQGALTKYLEAGEKAKSNLGQNGLECR